MEIEALSVADRAHLIEEAARAAGVVRALGVLQGRPAAKINIAALGNVVAQLHVHVVGRRQDDAAWPGPVWGVGIAEPYRPEDKARAAALVRAALNEA